VAALGRHRAARAAVGLLGVRILEACVAEGLSMQGAAAALGMNRQALSGALVLVLNQSGEHYHRADNGRPKKTLPATGAAHESMAA
jgi:hypothetical protein